MSAVRSCYRPPKRKRHVLRAVMLFFLPFPSHLIYHLTSCIRTHDHLRVALLLQMMFAAEPVRSCYRPPKRRPHVICSMGSFFLPFSLRSCNLLHPRLTTFCASLCSFKMCSLRNQFDPVFAHHNEKFHVLRAVGFFVAISLFPHLSFPPALKKSIASHPPKGYNT